MNKIKLAIFDLTDCEGCELQFLALGERLASFDSEFEIANWRLVSSDFDPGPFDATFIEGSPVTENDIEIVKRARAVSKKIIALGSCAVFGGVQAALPENQREKHLKEVYGKSYKSSSKSPKPVSYYIDVDIELPGCPINKDELEKLLASLSWDREFRDAQYPVCLECKARGNTCQFVENGFCMGPITKGGCNAPCPAVGLHCYGCFGPIEAANITAMHNVAGRYLDSNYIDAQIELYFKNTDQYKDYKTKGRANSRRFGA